MDLVVCNFALLGKQSVEGLVRAAPSLLTPNGSLIVQTLHPLKAGGEQPYRDGWREASWDGFGDGIFPSYPWYLRTLESWIGLFLASGFHPSTGQPASLLLIGKWVGPSQQPATAP